MSQAIANVWVKRLLVAWAFCFAVGSFCTTVLASLSNASWKDMDGQGKFMLVIAIVGNLMNTWGAFLYKSVTKVENGESPINGGTDIFKKPDPQTPKAP